MSIPIWFIGAINFLKLVVAVNLYAWRYRRRKNFWLRLVGINLLTTLVMIVVTKGPAHGYVESALYFLMTFLIPTSSLLFVYECSAWDALFAGIAGYLTEHFSTQIENILSHLFPMPEGTPEMVTFLAYIAAAVLIAYISFYFLFARRLHRGDNPNVKKKKLILLAAMSLILGAVLYIVVLNSQIYIEVLPADQQLTIILMNHIYAAFCALVTMMMLFGILTQNNLEKSLFVAKHLLHQSEEQYRMSRENIELINTKCHDLKYQIASLRKGASEESIRQIENAVLIYDSMVKTGNDVLDVILTEKSLYCQSKGIRMTCIIDAENLSWIETNDLYALFGNIVDNALDAIIKLDDPDKRELTLIVRRERNFLLIMAENYFEGTLEFENGLPKTTKKDKKYHGFGLRSVRILAEKYNGSMVIDVNDGKFALKIVMPIVTV